MVRSKIETIWEQFLWNSRFLVILAVISSLISAFFLFILGSVEILKGIKYVVYLQNFNDYHLVKVKMVTHIISAIDIFLIATVLLIFSIGLYELFISKIEEIEKDKKASKILQVHSLDELKEKIAKVIIMVLLVVFFKNAMEITYNNIEDLIVFSITILVISLAYYLLSKSDSLKKETHKG